MADYKELIRRAVEALPENNGAARRAVYEKARAALVGQLRGLDPPLSARDITQHRLQLEDCIRQVEQEASEAVIAGLKMIERPGFAAPRRLAPNPDQNEGPAPRAASPAAKPRPRATPAAHPSPSAKARPSLVQPSAAPAAMGRGAMPERGSTRAQVSRQSRPIEVDEPGSIEEIIAAEIAALEAEEPEIIAAPRFTSEKPVEPVARGRPGAETVAREADPEPVERRPLPSVVARAEAGKSAGTRARAFDANRRESAMEQRREAGRDLAAAREPANRVAPAAGHAAMSSVSEVEVDDDPRRVDPQTAIERAIATLEREARAEADGVIEAGDEEAIEYGKSRQLPAPTPAPVAEPFPLPAPMPEALPQVAHNRRPEADYRESGRSDPAFARPPVDNDVGGGSAVTIFLLVFLLLVLGVGGVGVWAWHDGFIDFNAMFGKSAPVTQSTPANPDATAPTTGAGSSFSTPGSASPKPVPNSGNTEPAPSPDLKTDARLSAQNQTGTPENAPTSNATGQSGAGPAAAPPVLSAQNEGPAKSDARLPGTSNGSAAATGGVTLPAGTTNGSQSLLLEASADGSTGAVPFSGTVAWTKGTDELGQPTLIGKADIPARNLKVSVLIRKNSDPTLPASNLMEINFTVSDTFVGGAISGLPGVLLKNSELVQGTPLVGASARVVGNSFLFALSASPADKATNEQLLTTRKWMDLAIIYATGKRAIITLEKDDKAEALFKEVFASWDKTKTPTTPVPAPPLNSAK